MYFEKYLGAMVMRVFASYSCRDYFMAEALLEVLVIDEKQTSVYVKEDEI